MGERIWHLEHADGREWTRDELAKVIGDEREHDGLWPYDASLIAVAIGDDSRVYLIDNCMTWHWLDEVRDGEDAVVVWDE